MSKPVPTATVGQGDVGPGIRTPKAKAFPAARSNPRRTAIREFSPSAMSRLWPDGRQAPSLVRYRQDLGE